MAPEQAAKFRSAPLVVLAAVLWLLGWLVGKVCKASTWMWFAVKVGWTDARTPRQS